MDDQTSTILFGATVSLIAIAAYLRSQKKKKLAPDYNEKSIELDIYAVARKIIACSKLLGGAGIISGAILILASFGKGELLFFVFGALCILTSVLQTAFFAGMAHMMVAVHEIRSKAQPTPNQL